MSTDGAAGAAGAEQPAAPYLDAVVGYAFRGTGRFHVPGHKGGGGADPALRFALGDRALAMDVPQDVHGIDIGAPPTPYEEAERLAAEAYGALRTFFLTNGATQGNHALCLALAPPGATIVVQRNSHASIVDALVLSGGIPAFVAPEIDTELGLAHGVTPASLDAALAAAPQARSSFVVSPTYYGMVADIEGLARVAHARDVALVVDQSWGPHLGFQDDLPPGALQLGADAVLTSTHKMVGSLTQSAMLHVAHRPDGPGPPRVAPDAVARTLRLLRSTSPSSLLMASLDAARRQLALHGEQLLHETLQGIAVARAKLETVHGVELVDHRFVGRPGVAGYDPLRIVLDVRGTGRTGYELSDALRRSYDVHPELATQATIVLVVGMGEPRASLERVAGDVEEVVARLEGPGSTAAIVRPPASFRNEMACSPREAFLGAWEVVEVDAAVGRVSCESVAGYPPGIPALLPGERITTEIVGYLREIVASGARLHGATDPHFERVTVLAGV